MSSEIQRILGRLEAKQDIIIEKFKDHEERMRKLEARMWMQSGAFAAAMVAWTFFGSYVSKALGFQ